jgi:plasmid maintenance system antidote protein VapI
MPKIGQRKNPFTIAVKKRLLERGLSVTDFARKIGFARNTVSMSIHRRRNFPNVRAAIKQELGV